AEQRRIVAERLEYEYPYPLLHDLKSKYSVSEINQDRGRLVTISEKGKLKEVRWKVHVRPGGHTSGNAAETGTLTAAEKGTLYHRIFEKIDFVQAANDGLEYIENTINEMVQTGVLQSEEAGQLDPENISRFFDSELGKRCAAAAAGGRLFREQPFTYLMPVRSLAEIAGIMNNEDQGSPGETTDEVTYGMPKIIVNSTGTEKISVQGVIDCFFEENGKLVLIDYKSSYMDERVPYEKEIERIRDKYAVQIEIYRNALASAVGRPVEEAYLYLTLADPGHAAIGMPELL
ncbi:MAG: PD-(D/E)XK nuclease family protein, partial [Eubacterium sp.]|nr:PD-(D/E)XK nuclease family protein [Eubacterium sp.]